MTQSDRRDREIEMLQERLFQLSEASLRINESLVFDVVLRGVLGSARYSTVTSLDGSDEPLDFVAFSGKVD